MRKITEKSKNTRSEIYNSAIQLFQTHGYEETTMRMIAKSAGVSLGLAYYHFKSKDDIVFHFYELVQKDSELESKKFCESNQDFRQRIRHIFKYKINKFIPHANFLHILAKLSGDPKSPLSPFSKESTGLRNKEILCFRFALENTNQKFPDELLELIPDLFWLLELVVIYYCLYDKSKNKEKTIFIIDSILLLTFQIIRLARLPIFSPIRKSILTIYNRIKSNN
jgi:AcrR family transcriptional regulator